MQQVDIFLLSFQTNNPVYDLNRAILCDNTKTTDIAYSYAHHWYKSNQNILDFDITIIFLKILDIAIKTESENDLQFKNRDYFQKI